MRRALVTAVDESELPEKMRGAPDDELQGFVWLNPETGELKEYVGGEWVVTAAFVPVPTTNVHASGTVEGNKGEFSSLEVDGQAGIDRDVVVGAETFKFRGGILYEVES
ncbi:hypothetical protein LCGC14_1368920 [marine sediment metagenome]|uniref:Uncharacterized protein n=1 Tax=marine sediment metagenome TaxID=412755 RepID=A0A0F9KRX3_9ZZZZ